MDQAELIDLQHRLLTLAGMIMEDRSVALIGFDDPATAAACLASSASELSAIAVCCDVIGRMTKSAVE